MTRRESNALAKRAEAFRQGVAFRKRRFAARFTSEGVWDRLALALARTPMEGLFRVPHAPDGAELVARFSRLGGRGIEVYTAHARPSQGAIAGKRELLHLLTRGESGRGGIFVCWIPPVDPAILQASHAARLLGFRGGRSRSIAKRAASRRNGRRGGRPRRALLHPQSSTGPAFAGKI